MCKPRPTEGAFFKSSWLKTYHNAPSRDTMKTYIAVDFAVTESATADYTAIVVFGLDPSSDIFVLDCLRRQCDAATSVDALLDMVRDWKPLCVVTEAGGLKNAIGPFLTERMRQRHIYAPLETIPSRHAKEIRAQSIAGRMAVRGLFLPAQAPWLSDFWSVRSWPFRQVRTTRSTACRFSASCWTGSCRGVCRRRRSRRRCSPQTPLSDSVTLTDLFEQEDRRWKKGGAGASDNRTKNRKNDERQRKCKLKVWSPTGIRTAASASPAKKDDSGEVFVHINNLVDEDLEALEVGQHICLRRAAIEARRQTPRRSTSSCCHWPKTASRRPQQQWSEKKAHEH